MIVLRHLHLAAPLLALGLLSGCFMNISHVREEAQGPTDEELLELYTTTATYLYDDGSLDRAQDQAVKALELEPDNQAMRRMIGWIRVRMGRNEDLLIALEFFRDLLAEGDTNEATALGLATTLERLGTAYDAAARRVAAGEMDPPFGQNSEDLERQADDHWRESLQRYEGTLTEGEGSTTAMNGLQRIHALLGDYETSLDWTQQLLQRSTDEMEVWRRMLTQSDLTREEERLFRENEEIAQRLQTESHLLAATLLNRLERTDEAIVHLNSVAEETPQLPQVYSLRAQLLLKSGEYDRALQDLDRFLALSSAPFEHPEIQRAFQLRTEAEAKLAQSVRSE